MSRVRDYVLAGVVGFSAFGIASVWERAQEWIGMAPPPAGDVAEAGEDEDTPADETPPADEAEAEAGGGEADGETDGPDEDANNEASEADGAGEGPVGDEGAGEDGPAEDGAGEDAGDTGGDGAPEGPLTDWLGDEFAYLPAGDLIPGSGEGRADETIYAPGIRFPMELPRAFANSQVYMPGGQFGPSGWQCDPVNYQYPWRDNFCEDRRYATPFCPSGTGHQGQDIRPPTCPPLEPRDARPEYWAVAAADGQITGVTGHIVTLDADDGTRFLYMHLDPDSLVVDAEDRVARGDRIGVISNYFGSTPTTYHLHLEIRQTVAVDGQLLTLTPVPPYASLVDAYERLLDGEEGDFPAPGE